jgi:twitching motility protein PilU
MEQLVHEGLQTFDQALFTLYKEGVINYEEALVNADSANNLRLKIKTAGLPIPGEKDISDTFEFKQAEAIPSQQPSMRRPKMKR